MRRFKRMLVIVTASLVAQTINADPVQLDPSRIGWETARFRASKLFFSVDTAVSIDRVMAADVADTLIAPQTGVGVDLANDVMRLRLGTDAFGRHNDMVLFLNTISGEAVQRVTHETGGRLRHRVYRFTDLGAYHDTRKPGSESEEDLPDERWREWTNHSTGLYAYPEEAAGNLITEPAGLLYIVGAARLDKPGDYLEMLAYARKRVHRVHIDVVGPVTVKANYKRWSGGKGIEQRGERTALRLSIEGEPVGAGDPEDEFELLGLRGKMQLLLDPETRAPLLLSGRAKIVGNVTLRIKHLAVAANSNRE